MEALDIENIASDIPLVDGDEFLNLLSLDVDEIGDDAKSINLSKGFNSSSSSNASGVAFSPVEEDLEWISNKDAFPSVESNFFDDKLAGMGLLGQQHSPVSVLESIIVNDNGDVRTSTNNKTIRDTLKLPTGFPEYTRKKRVGRKPGIRFNQYMHLFLVRPQEIDLIQPMKIVRKNRATTVGRRCSHCGSDKTPQWRTGPMGKKTLCNACGVRYKSGRLVPEYRPANSPTFSSVLHSNSHRKIMEMRRQTHEGIGQKIMVNETF